MCVSAREEAGHTCRTQRFPKSAETIPPRLASLKSCSITELKQQWRALYDSEPPLRISRELLTRARRLSHSGASLRRTQTIDPKTADSSRQ